MNFGRQQSEPLSLDDERAMLHESRMALDALKAELAERVKAVREREEELRQAIADAKRGEVPAAPLPPAPKAGDASPTTLELQRRERAVADRERELAARAAELAAREQAVVDRDAAATSAGSHPMPAPPDIADGEREARIEARLAELKEAERLFLRTRDELAARSEAVAARERLVAQREREQDEVEDAPKRGAQELAELEERLARLEQGAGEDTLGFSDGFRKLRQSGARQPPDDRRR